jgi:hypothetical protein
LSMATVVPGINPRPTLKVSFSAASLGCTFGNQDESA